VIGPLQFDQFFRGKEGGQTALVVEVTAFDFALGLRGGGIAESHPVEMQGGPQLGKSIRDAGEEEATVVHVKGQRQAVGAEGALQEVQVGQEGLGLIEPGGDIEARGVIQQVEQDVSAGLQA
jgi:hypothetical protein